jgi:hypothetical protein
MAIDVVMGRSLIQPNHQSRTPLLWQWLTLSAQNALSQRARIHLPSGL